MRQAENFTPPRWFKNPHLQTLWASSLRPRPVVETRRERIELPDGDFIDLDWGEQKSGPLVVIFHGLEGSSQSKYARGMLNALTSNGMQGVIMNFRGCSGEPNRLARAYHSGDTADMAYIVMLLKQRAPGAAIAAIGYSLGGNALLKWLGETGNNNPLDAAIAVSVPFDLDNAAHVLRHSAFGLYQSHLLKQLKASLRKKAQLVANKIDLEAALQATNFHEFDNLATAPLHGFRDVNDYYHQSSSFRYLAGIRVPTWLIHAMDDPFMNTQSIPLHDRVPGQVQLDIYDHGGHVGFIDRRGYWLERHVPVRINNMLSTLD